MAAASRLIDEDLGWSRLKRDLQHTKDATVVRIGVQGADAEEDHDGITNVELAAVHEYGTLDGHVPERAPIRSTIDENAEKYHALAKMLAGRVIDGTMTTRRALGIMGARILADIKRSIQRGLDPPLKEATVRRKKSSKPLIETTQLLGAYSYEVGAREDES